MCHFMGLILFHFLICLRTIKENYQIVKKGNKYDKTTNTRKKFKKKVLLLLFSPSTYTEKKIPLTHTSKFQYPNISHLHIFSPHFFLAKSITKICKFTTKPSLTITSSKTTTNGFIITHHTTKTNQKRRKHINETATHCEISARPSSNLYATQHNNDTSHPIDTVASHCVLLFIGKTASVTSALLAIRPMPQRLRSRCHMSIWE